MNRKLFILLIFIFFGLLISWHYYENTQNNSYYYNFFNELENRHVLDHNFDKFLLNIFTKTGNLMDVKKSFNINSKYTSKEYNVYVINFNKINKINLKDKKLEELIKLCKNNFIAIPPNIICIDSNILSFLMIECTNDIVGFGQYLDDDNSIENYFNNSMNEFINFQRLSNYNKYFNNPEEVHSIGVSLVKAFYNIGEDFNTKNSPYTLFLMPLISHEIAHLQNNSFGAYKNTFILEQFITKVYKKWSTEEEDFADAVALKTIEKYIDKNNLSIIEIQELLIYTKFWRDYLLYETYTNFRGLTPSLLLVEIKLKKNIEKKAPTRNLQYTHIDNIEEAKLLGPPTMTVEEFNEIMKEFEKNGSSISHRHIFIRTLPLLKLISKKYSLQDLTYLLQPYYNLFISYKNNNYSFIFKDNIDETKGLAITYDQVVNNIKKYLNINKAINYKNNKCLIGLFKNKTGGYLELWGSKNNIKKTKLIFSLVNDNNEFVFENLHIYLCFLINFFENEKEGYEFAINNYYKLRNNYYPNYTIKKENKIFKFRTLNDSKYISIEVKRNNS